LDSVWDESGVRRKVRCHTVAVDFFVDVTGLERPKQEADSSCLASLARRNDKVLGIIPSLYESQFPTPSTASR
jgi:hypothetical protein